MTTETKEVPAPRWVVKDVAEAFAAWLAQHPVRLGAVLAGGDDRRKVVEEFMAAVGADATRTRLKNVKEDADAYRERL